MVQVRRDSCDYTIVTELPGIRASHEQVERLYTRYKFASEYCKGKDVIEVACGAGIGLGFLAKYARKIVGADIHEANLRYALETYRGLDNLEIMPLDAQAIPLNDNSFDVVILYEAIYYLSRPEKFIDEARRLLRDNGVLLICTANKTWAGFNPSPFSYRYFSADELYLLLTEKGFDVELFADSPVTTDSYVDKALLTVKKSAVKLHLIPKTMRGKEKLKRLFLGRLMLLPQKMTDEIGVDYHRPVSISDSSTSARFKVLFAVGRKKGIKCKGIESS